MELVLSYILAEMPAIIAGISDASKLVGVIAMLEKIVPVVVAEAKDLVQPVKNIIAALRAHDAVTSSQLDQLDQQEAKLDADTDAAAAAALAEDKAAGSAQ